MILKIINLIKQTLYITIVVAVISVGLLVQPISVKKITPSSPDAIIILGGGGGLRVTHYATSLHERYPFVPVIYTGGIPFFGRPIAQHMVSYARALGVHAPAIAIDTSKSTLDDARHTRQYFQKNNQMPTSILVVTSDYHTGRSLWVFRKVFKGVDVGIESVPDQMNDRRWWKDYNTAQHVLEEKARFLFYRLVVLCRPSIIKV